MAMGRLPPRWLFALLAAGGFVACGIYTGIIHSLGSSTGNILRAVGYGVFGLVMLWGVLGKR
jgi:hypothetical protein